MLPLCSGRSSAAICAASLLLAFAVTSCTTPTARDHILDEGRVEEPYDFGIAVTIGANNADLRTLLRALHAQAGLAVDYAAVTSASTNVELSSVPSTIALDILAFDTGNLARLNGGRWRVEPLPGDFDLSTPSFVEAVQHDLKDARPRTARAEALYIALGLARLPRRGISSIDVVRLQSVYRAR